LKSERDNYAEIDCHTRFRNAGNAAAAARNGHIVTPHNIVTSIDDAIPVSVGTRSSIY
jgi:hypothetical protein